MWKDSRIDFIIFFTMDKSKPFGLVLPKKNKALQAKKTPILDSDSDEEPARKKPNRTPQAKPLSKKLEQKELCEDPSIDEYDNMHDDKKAPEVATVIFRKNIKLPRYIDVLLKANDISRKEYERRIERRVEVKREKEGDKFKDRGFCDIVVQEENAGNGEAEERERRENMLND